MCVDDYILKTVVFVGVEGDGLFTPMGTGFLVAVKEADLYGIYLVTAAHVVEQINSDHIFVRINKTKGSTDGCVTVKVPTKNIRRHNDPRNDIAVFPFPFDKSVTDHMPIAMGSDHLGNSRAEIWEPGIGDEVAAVGLYTSHYGETRNR
jgi:hypothetical protein